MEPLIELADLRKEYPMPGGPVVALRGATLSIARGEYVAIMGDSGSGKSTLLYLLGLLVSPSSGSHRFEGVEVGRLSDADRARLRGRRIGFVFQSFHLVPQLTVLQNVLLGARYTAEDEEAADRARRLLARVGLSHRLGHHPGELSGGEMQRTAIARALLMDPQVILADEPTGNLDARTGGEIAGLLDELHREGRTLVLVTHNPALAERASRRVMLADGEVRT